MQLQAKARLQASANQEDVLEVALQRQGLSYTKVDDRTFKIKRVDQASALASLLRRIVEHFDKDEGAYLDHGPEGYRIFNPKSDWRLTTDNGELLVKRVK